MKDAAENVEDPLDTADILVNVPRAVVGKLDGTALVMRVGGDIEVTGVEAVVVVVIEGTVVVIVKMGAPLALEFAFFFGFLGVSVGCMTIIWVPGVEAAGTVAMVPGAPAMAIVPGAPAMAIVDASVLEELAASMEDGKDAVAVVVRAGPGMPNAVAMPLVDEVVVLMALPMLKAIPPILTGTPLLETATPARLAGTPARLAGTPARVAGTPLFVKTMLRPPPGDC